jgi:ubiquinone/menaquinone biosynthesis C-methylase UbiE
MIDYFAQEFDWSSAELVNICDELPLWSAMAGLLLLEHLPMSPNISALDVGCGTGFPLLELAQRLGPGSRVVGIDTWEQAINRATHKAALLGIDNVEIVTGDAANMPFADSRFDLIVSNLGVNNFSSPAAALVECNRVARPGAHICLTTNLRGHMKEFYEEYAAVLNELGMTPALSSLAAHIEHRTTVELLGTILQQAGFVSRALYTRTIKLRYINGSAMLRHSLIRTGFLDAWRKVVEPDQQRTVFLALENRLNRVAKTRGELSLTIPLAYVEATKPE